MCYVSYGPPCFVVLSPICCSLLRSPFGWKARCTRATPRQPKAFRCAENFENTKTAQLQLPASTRICCAACGGWTAGRNLTKLQDIIMLSKCLAAWPQVVQYHAISTTPFNLTSTLSVYVCFCPAPKLSKQKFFQVTLGWRPATKVRFEFHMPQAVEVLGFTTPTSDRISPTQSDSPERLSPASTPRIAVDVAAAAGANR